MRNYNTMYEKIPNLVFGFHGCNRSTYENVLFKNQMLKSSENKYDWLGNGIYFWENSYQRAYDWANQKYKNNDPAVLGAVIDLGTCLNLTDYYSSDILKKGYEMLKLKSEALGISLPLNGKKNKNSDVLLRDLDCAVIQQIHEFNKATKFTEYDSVRGVFLEGKEAYPGSEFKERTHVQLCIINPNCIKGFFSPRKINEKYHNP